MQQSKFKIFAGFWEINVCNPYSQTFCGKETENQLKIAPLSGINFRLGRTLCKVGVESYAKHNDPKRAKNEKNHKGPPCGLF